MKKERIHDLGKKLGLNKQDIDSVLRNRICNNISVSISYSPDCYKDGTMYGTVSIMDL